MRQTRAVGGTRRQRATLRGRRLGHLADAPRYDQAANADLMTQPTDVEPFIAQTGIDLLAVSVGTEHGMYAPGVVPAIGFSASGGDFALLEACLWHYGGSGTPSSAPALYDAGGCKINVGAAIFRTGKSALRTVPSVTIYPLNWWMLQAMELAFEEAITPYVTGERLYRLEA